MLSYSKRNLKERGQVSIIIPAYNAENWIKRSISSALKQTYPDIEVIVVENGSTDHTTGIIESINDSRVHCFHSEKGVSNARNTGIKHAHGNYITFLDSDDWLAEDAIENMIAECDKNVDIVSARYFSDQPFERYISKKYPPGSQEYILKCLYTPTKRGNSTGNLYRTEFIRKHKIHFQPELSHAEDSVFFISALLSNPVVVDLEKPVYHVFKNPVSATRTRNTESIEHFCSAVSDIYSLLSTRGDELVNGGYIFALNQLLVILVHNPMNLREMRSCMSREVFRTAIEKSDIGNVDLLKKTVFWMTKKKMILPLSIAVRLRENIDRIKK